MPLPHARRPQPGSRRSSRWSAPTAPASRPSRSSTRPSRRSNRRRRSRQPQPPAAAAAAAADQRSPADPPQPRPDRAVAIAFAVGEAGSEQPRLERLELGAVVEVDEMRDLVRDDVAAHLRRREDQPPAERIRPCDEQLPQRVPASPTLTERDVDAGRCGEFGGLARHGVERAAA